jgi:hypothetical protein
MKTGILFAGEGVGHAPHSIKLFGNLLSTSPFCPFEEHVLNEMG